MKNLKNSNGITLVALVVTIVVLLILTSISINILNGDNGFITKAREIRNNIEKAEAEGQAKINSLQQAEYTEDGAVILNDENAPTINSMEVTNITETSFTVKVTVTETGSGLAKIEYSIDDGEHYITPNYNQAKSYTFEDLKIGFEEYKVKVKATDINNNSSYASKTVEKFKIGDYVNYTYDTAENYTNLTGTGSTSNPAEGISQSGTTLKWRILNIDVANRTIDLVSENPTDNKVYFSGALGYNNGVYLLNDICEKLYSNNALGVKARSINLEDMEKHLTPAGFAARNSYTGAVKYGTTKLYEESNSYYPKLYETQKGAGINLSDEATVTQPNIEGTVDPYNESSKGYFSVTTETYEQANTSGLTVTQTYYYIPINEANYGTAASVLRNSNYFWVASRCVATYSSLSFATFGIRSAFTSAEGYYMLSTGGSSYDRSRCLRPVVSLDGEMIDKGLGKDPDNVWEIK